MANVASVLVRRDALGGVDGFSELHVRAMAPHFVTHMHERNAEMEVLR